MTEPSIKLTSSEIASLWASYMQNSMAVQILNYFLNTVEDSDIRAIVEKAHSLADHVLNDVTHFFHKEGLPIPDGFSDKDVNLEAPRLYTDSFMLTYINHMSKAGMLGATGFLSMSARRDIRKFYKEILSEISDLYDESTETLLKKGLYVRSPYIPYPEQKDYVDSKKYFSGLNIFSKRRPLNSVEIAHLHMNIQTNQIGAVLSISFAQVSPTKEIQTSMLRGKDISDKHIKVFSTILMDNSTQAPSTSDVAITNSTGKVFSDKLMTFHMGMLTAAGTGNYATAAAASQRSDLILNYERLSVEVAQYAKELAGLMIQNEWLEQPPGTLDREELAREKKGN